MRILLFVVLLVSCSVSMADEIRLGVHNFPPYITVDSAGHCSGEAIEITRDILQNDTIKVNTVCATAARLYKMLQSGEVDLTINIKHTKALPNDVSFVEPPYAQLTLTLLTHGAAIAREKHLTIAAIRGFDYHGQRHLLSEQGYSFTDLPDSLSAVELFVKGRSSALLTYEGPFIYYLQQHNLPFAKHYQRRVIETIDTHYVISAASAHQDYIRQTLQHYATINTLSYFSRQAISTD
ncbi:substrate-binding periplasmic protein [Rheinheimera maricola]|uniref:Transporter substrate-binding domain-containing protein n=1 Tax=Rheinheimera maricola TaxID=2793282 RepID=A0ABS7XB33_9GAMM|nr:transporter substrate-binding domain-containing protein [Rheinheimera maricola]MBZ9612766.1 transporter substrate-binding domain-containing protein [Rheinheimera maricola]